MRTINLGLLQIKNMKCCYPNCTDCSFSDCIMEGVTITEINQSATLDREASELSCEQSKQKEIDRRYYYSTKGQETYKKYRKSESYKKVQSKYRSTERAKELDRARARKSYWKKKEAALLTASQA